MAGETGEVLYTANFVQGTNASSGSTPVQMSTIHWVQRSEFETPHMQSVIEGSSTKKHGPTAYFKYLKTRMSPLELWAFKTRIKKLEKMVDKYAKLGQEALSDECLKQYVVLSRESAMWACGFKIFLTLEQVEKFRYTVEKLKFTPLKNFARVIPPKAAKRLEKAMVNKLFDDYVVVHLDNKKVSAVKETDKERVKREKDPICFGKIQYSDRYYFVADWEDELDDLRLEDIIKKLSLNRNKIKLIADLDETGIQNAIKDRPKKS